MQRFHLLLWPNSKARGQHLTIQPLLATVKHFIHIFLFTYLSHTTCLFYSPPLTPQNPHYPIQALQDTPLHPNGSIITKQLAQLWIASPWTNQSFNFSSLPSTRWSASASTALTIFSFQAYQTDISNIEREWETAWEVVQELSKNPKEPATIPLSSSSTTHTNISSTNHNSISPFTSTSTSYTHSHTTGNLHHSNTTTTTTTSFITFAPTIFSKKSGPKNTKKSVHTTSQLPPPPQAPQRPPLILLLHPPFPSDNHILKRPKSAYPKRQAPTLNIFCSTDIGFKSYRKSPLPFENQETNLIKYPTTSSKLSTSTSTEIKDVTFHHKITTPKQLTSTTDKKHAPKTPFPPFPSPLHSLKLLPSCNSTCISCPRSTHRQPPQPQPFHPVPPSPIFSHVFPQLQQSGLWGALPL